MTAVDENHPCPLCRKITPHVHNTKIKTTVTEEHAPLPTAIGRKWGVRGWTQYRPESNEAKITLTWRDVGSPPAGARVCTLLHEQGHVGVAQDIVDGVDDVRVAMEVLDRWDTEVEAWLRALENSLPPWRQSFEFILDCLNTYRRGLPASDQQWYEAVQLLNTYCPKLDLSAYVPLEPDPNDEMPQCMAVGSGDGGSSGSVPSQFDQTWFQPEVLDLMTASNNLRLVAERFNLKPEQAPPLIRAMDKTGRWF